MSSLSNFATQDLSDLVWKISSRLPSWCHHLNPHHFFSSLSLSLSLSYQQSLFYFSLFFFLPNHTFTLLHIYTLFFSFLSHSHCFYFPRTHIYILEEFPWFDEQVLNCFFKVSEFKLQSCYYILFLTNALLKGTNPLIHPAWG